MGGMGGVDDVVPVNVAGAKALHATAWGDEPAGKANVAGGGGSGDGRGNGGSGNGSGDGRGNGGVGNGSGDGRGMG